MDDHVSEGPIGDLGYAQYAVGYIREMRGIWSQHSSLGATSVEVVIEGIRVLYSYEISNYFLIACIFFTNLQLMRF